MFNLRREPWNDPRVREAIRLMFNFEWSNQTLFYGLYDRINSVWENSWLAATGAPRRPKWRSCSRWSTKGCCPPPS